MVSDARIAIVGGGLSGLMAGTLLEQQGVRDWVLFEARGVLGGRILCIDGDGAIVDPTVSSIHRFDLGPAWFWPGLQPQLDRLIAALGLPRFAQFDDGAVLIERSAAEAPWRVQGDAEGSGSMRVAGGTGALVAALHSRLDAHRVRLGEAVRGMSTNESGVALRVESRSGEVSTWRASQVLLALPPRVALRDIAFDPPLPPELARLWHHTPTWMAPHAKYVAVYDTPFWRAQGLCGAARSGRGPMGEIHDASVPGGQGALFGFLGVPARTRQRLTPDALREHCRAQLARLFGEPAAAPLADAIKDWAADPLTATEADQDATAHHAAAPPHAADEGPWQGRFIGIGSEWSRQFPGYLAGAVDAATRGVQWATHQSG